MKRTLIKNAILLSTFISGFGLPLHAMKQFGTNRLKAEDLTLEQKLIEAKQRGDIDEVMCLIDDGASASALFEKNKLTPPDRSAGTGQSINEILNMHGMAPINTMNPLDAALVRATVKKDFGLLLNAINLGANIDLLFKLYGMERLDGVHITDIETKLCDAVINQDIPKILFWIAHGANVNHSFGEDGMTPLQWAVYTGADACVAHALLLAGAQVNTITKNSNKTALDFAIEGKWTSAIQLLRQWDGVSAFGEEDFKIHEAATVQNTRTLDDYAMAEQRAGWKAMQNLPASYWRGY